MMKILLAVDGSPYTKKMLAYLAAHDELLGNGARHAYTVITVQAALPPRARAALSKEMVNDYYAEEAAKVLDPVTKFLAQHGITPAKDWRPKQYALYEKALPQLAKLTDVGTTDDNTFSVEKVISTKPDLVILGAWNYDALGESVKQIEAAGIPMLTLNYNAQTVEKIGRAHV